MTFLPFIISVSGQPIGSPASSFSELTVEDPLPSVLMLSTDGYVLSHGTRVTEVNQETTDDN